MCECVYMTFSFLRCVCTVIRCFGDWFNCSACRNLIRPFLDTQWVMNYLRLQASTLISHTVFSSLRKEFRYAWTIAVVTLAAFEKSLSRDKCYTFIIISLSQANVFISSMSSRQPILSNLACSVLVLILSLFFGCLPLIISKKKHSFSAVRWTEERKTFLLAFLLNFGGGVLIANCFCHWLPEAREGKLLSLILQLLNVHGSDI